MIAIVAVTVRAASKYKELKRRGGIRLKCPQISRTRDGINIPALAKAATFSEIFLVSRCIYTKNHIQKIYAIAVMMGIGSEGCN